MQVMFLTANTEEKVQSNNLQTKFPWHVNMQFNLCTIAHKRTVIDTTPGVW